jgi:hypothetical protein
MAWALLAALAPAGSAVWAADKRHRHPEGFSFQAPNNWKVENGEGGALLIPRGVTVDPGREDNPEVYTVRPSPADAVGFEKEMVAGVRESLAGQGVRLEQDSRPELFGRNGSIYTFDFVHPARKAAFRIRVFAMRVKGRVIALIASGLRDRVASRDKALREVAASLDYDR